MKPTLRQVLTVLLLAGIAAGVAGGEGDVTVAVAGREVELAPAATMQGGTTVGPWATCAQAAGASVAWDPEHGVLAITSVHGRRLTAGPGAEFRVDDRPQALPAPVEVAGGQLVAPLKPLFEALDCIVQWDGRRRRLDAWGKVTAIQTRGDADGVAIQVITSIPVVGKLHSLDDEPPPRWFVDLPGARLGLAEGTNYINVAGVLRARWAEYEKAPPVTRVVADLADKLAPARWQASPDGCGGRLVIGRIDGDEPIIERSRPKLLKVDAASSDQDTTTITATLSDPVEPVYDVLRRPYRVLLDLGGAQIEAAPSEFAVHVPFVQGVKLLEEGRLALYMSELVRFSAQTMRGPDRIEITFHRDKLAGKKIAVDPGHGGKDSGARGRYLLEKDVNLDVARRVVMRLTLMDARPFLTRDSDVFIELYDRPRITNALGVDMFVSVHCNAYTRRDVGQGTQTYYCTPQSKCLAVVMQDALTQQLQRKDAGVHRDRFVVVRETQIPAVLVELLYLDNKVEENLLAKPEVRQRAAIGVCEGLRRFVEGTSSPAPSLLIGPEEARENTEVPRGE